MPRMHLAAFCKAPRFLKLCKSPKIQIRKSPPGWKYPVSQPLEPWGLPHLAAAANSDFKTRLVQLCHSHGGVCDLRPFSVAQKGLYFILVQWLTIQPEGKGTWICYCQLLDLIKNFLLTLFFWGKWFSRGNASEWARGEQQMKPIDCVRSREVHYRMENKLNLNISHLNLKLNVI